MIFFITNDHTVIWMLPSNHEKIKKMYGNPIGSSNPEARTWILTAYITPEAMKAYGYIEIPIKEAIRILQYI